MSVPGEIPVALDIRSVTASYLDLADFAVPVAGAGERLHVLSDQQWCRHWLLYAGADDQEAFVGDRWVYLRGIGVSAEDIPIERVDAG